MCRDSAKGANIYICYIYYKYSTFKRRDGIEVAAGWEEEGGGRRLDSAADIEEWEYDENVDGGAIEFGIFIIDGGRGDGGGGGCGSAWEGVGVYFVSDEISFPQRQGFCETTTGGCWWWRWKKW